MYYPAEKLAQFPWIVSNGTLRPDHLADAYLGAMDALELECLEPFRSDLRQCAAYASDTVGPEPAEPWLQALDWAFGALNDAAPSGFYFGASESDGACFGFWLDQDWCAAMDQLGFGNDDPTGWAELIGRLIEDGIEPDSIEDAYQGRAEGWSEQQAGADYAQQMAQDAWLPDGPNGIGWNRWPVSCIDWSAAWEEIRIGDGYRLHDIGGGEWLVFRDV